MPTLLRLRSAERQRVPIPQPPGTSPLGVRKTTATTTKDNDLIPHDADTQRDAPDTPTAVDPNVTFDSITFSDDTTINVALDDIVVFVGPNNAGKSQALRELEQHCVNNPILVSS